MLEKKQIVHVLLNIIKQRLKDISFI